MMRNRWSSLLLVGSVVALLLAACSGPLLGPEEGSLEPAVSRSVAASETGEYLVVYRSGALSRQMRSRIEAAGGTIVKEIPQIGVASVRSSDPGFASAAARIGGVTHVGPDLMTSLDLPESQIVHADLAVEGIEDNDLYMLYQWDIRRVGGDATTWGIEKGGGATVAVLDTGVYWDHPDIAPNYAYGKDFTDITVELPPGWIMWDQGGPQDYNGHGTHVAGSIAGAITSGRIIGVAPEASIANYKVMVAVLIPEEGGYVASGIGFQSWIVDGIVTAADDGVNVINMSLGGWLAMNEPGGAAAYVAYLRATQYARKQGTLVVASSGNSGLDLTRQRPVFHVPSGTPAAISVNATGPDDSLAFYSNYGASETRFVAPGGDISDPPFSFCLSAYSPLNAWAPGAGYVFSIGTSMAAPKVAGVAALVYANNPGINPAQVESRLMQTAEPLGKPGFDPRFGHGMVHAYRALTRQRK
jgi:lantibiotic leader peptide-processing serine protease